MRRNRYEFLNVTNISDKSVVIEISQELEFTKIAIIGQILKTFAQQGHVWMELDLTKVHRIDPYGFSMLIDIQNYLNSKGGILSLTNISPEVKDSIKVNNLEEHFEFDLELCA